MLLHLTVFLWRLPAPLMCFCHLNLVPQLAQGRTGGSRRLRQWEIADDLLLTIQIDFFADIGGLWGAMDLFQEAPCELGDFCSVFLEMAPEVVEPAPVVSVDWSLTVQSYSGGVLRVKSTYLRNGEPREMLAVLTTAAGDALSCTSEYTGGSRYYACVVSIGPYQTLTVSATVPNLADIDAPLSKEVQVLGSGEHSALQNVSPQSAVVSAPRQRVCICSKIAVAC